MELLHFVIFDEAGRIVRRGGCTPPDMPHHAVWAARDGLRLLSGSADPAADYVDVAADPPAIRPRPALAGFARLALAVGETAAMAVPRGAVVTVNGASVEVDDGVIDLVAECPMAYRVVVEAWPYLTYSAELTVCASA